MQTKKINWFMFLCTLVTGFLGWLLAEYIVVNLIYGNANNQVPNVISVGIYFVLLTVFGCLGVIISELIHPTFNNHLSTARHSFVKRIFISVVGVGLVFVLLISMLFQWLYSLAVGTENGKSDIVIMMDCSGSLEYGSTNLDTGEELPPTDPTRQRIEAAKEIVETLAPSQKVALIAFTDEAFTAFDFHEMTYENKLELQEQLDGLASDGSTDLRAALDYAYGEIIDNELVNPVVMLFSDGEDSSFNDSNLNDEIRGYLNSHIPIYAVQVNAREDDNTYSVLEDVAKATGGEYTPIESADEISEAFIDTFNTIRMNSNQNLVLLFNRSGYIEGSPLYFFFIRILCFMFIAGSVGAAYTILLNSKEAIIVNVLSGLAAGLIIELGTWLFGNFFLVRMIAALLIIGVICRYVVSNQQYVDPYQNKGEGPMQQMPPQDDPFQMSSSFDSHY